MGPDCDPCRAGAWQSARESEVCKNSECARVEFLHMKIGVILLVLVLLPIISAQGQEGPASIIEIANEPHHSLLFQNSEVRVFRLRLQPDEITLPHRHKAFYAYFSLRPITIGNEVRGRQPVVTRLEAGELHTSKGGFTVAERNKSTESADLIVIEAAKLDGGGFSTPMGGFRFRDAAFGELFEAPLMRAYTMTLAVGGRTEQHTENYDRLLVAISDLKLHETVAGGASSDLEMKAGETHWVSRGMSHAVTNVGESPATFITLEFN